MKDNQRQKFEEKKNYLRKATNLLLSWWLRIEEYQKKLFLLQKQKDFFKVKKKTKKNCSIFIRFIPVPGNSAAHNFELDLTTKYLRSERICLPSHSVNNTLFPLGLNTCVFYFFVILFTTLKEPYFFKFRVVYWHLPSFTVL